MQAKPGRVAIVRMPGLPGAPRLRIGRLLLSRGLVNVRQLAHAAGVQETGLAAADLPPGERLGTILTRLGYVRPMHLVRALCDQAGTVNFLVFGRYLVEPPLTRHIPRGLAHVVSVLPLVRLPGSSYLVASERAPAEATLARLEWRLRGRVEPIVVRERDFHATIDACYDALEHRGAWPVRLGEVLVRDRLV